jgi:hypothetical protein
VSPAWLVVLIVGVATMALKAIGPVFLGGKPLPGRVQSVVGLLAPALLAALVITSVLAIGRDLVFGPRHRSGPGLRRTADRDHRRRRGPVASGPDPRGRHRGRGHHRAGPGGRLGAGEAG